MDTLLGHRRPVARTTLELPFLGFGGVPIAELYRRVAEDEAQQTLSAAWDAGVRYFDTAPWYGRGQSEHRIGRFLRGMPRADYVLVTKVGRVLRRPADPAHFSTHPFAGGLPFDITFDYTFEGVMRSYEQSLQRLGINTVDALVIHDLDRVYHGDRFDAFRDQLIDGGGLRALAELKASGDIRAVGMGFNRTAELEEFVRLIDLDFALVAMPYTLLDQGGLSGGMAECERRGISVVIGSPFASGVLATGSAGLAAKYNYADAPVAILEKVRGLEAACARHGVTLRAAALQFLPAHPAVVSIIPGATTATEFLDNIASLSAPIPAAFWQDLRARNLIDQEAPVPL